MNIFRKDYIIYNIARLATRTEEFIVKKDSHSIKMNLKKGFSLSIVVYPMCEMYETFFSQAVNVCVCMHVCSVIYSLLCIVYNVNMHMMFGLKVK